MENIWHKVPEYEHIEVTRCGRVRTAPYVVTRKDRHGNMTKYQWKAKELSLHLSDNGYLRCSVQRNGKRGPIYHHRLIALTFVDGYKDGYHVNHINGNKTDNRPENLEWVTIEENTKHQWRTGLVASYGEKNPMHKLSEKKVLAIRRALADGAKPGTLAIIAGVSHTVLLKIQSGERWASVVEGSGDKNAIA